MTSQIPADARQGSLAQHRAKSAQQEPAKAEHLLDDGENRLDSGLALGVESLPAAVLSRCASACTCAASVGGSGSLAERAVNGGLCPSRFSGTNGAISACSQQATLAGLWYPVSANSTATLPNGSGRAWRLATAGATSCWSLVRWVSCCSTIRWVSMSTPACAL